MTIKKQIYFSNARVVVITIVTLLLIPFIIRVCFRLWGDESFIAEIERGPSQRGRIPVSLAFAALFVFIIVTTIVNNLLTYRLIKNIAKPLESLSEGVRQVQRYNLAYRVDYQKDDEFRPICDAFNEMTAYLETAAVKKQKDETSRRELIAGISHDLRTPLTSLKGYIEGIETGIASTPDMRQKYFDIIKSKTVDLEHIIEQLFLFSKLDMDEFPLAPRRVAIVPVVQDMAEEIAGEYAARGLDIHIAETPETAAAAGTFVNTDTIWLRNVMLNIFENSRVYKTKERGRVEISAALVNGNTVMFTFTDDGPGVNAESVEKLFSAFYRTDPSRDKKGSGLGLAISAKIIERMGGSCRAELPPSGGLAIVIYLPVAGTEI